MFVFRSQLHDLQLTQFYGHVILWLGLLWLQIWVNWISRNCNLKSNGLYKRLPSPFLGPKRLSSDVSKIFLDLSAFSWTEEIFLDMDQKAKSGLKCHFSSPKSIGSVQNHFEPELIKNCFETLNSSIVPSKVKLF